MLVVVGLTLVMVLGTSACSNGTGTQKNPRVIGFAGVGDGEGAWRRAEEQRIVAALEDSGFDVEYRAAEGLDAHAQTTIVREFISEKVSAILLNPIQAHNWADMMGSASSSGIPVILLDQRLLPDEQQLYTAHIGVDYTSVGQKIARWIMTRWIIQQAQSDADVLVLQGGASSSSTLDMTAGFQAQMADQGNGAYLMVSVLTGSWDRDYAQNVVTQQLADMKRQARFPAFIFAQSDLLAQIARDETGRLGVKVCQPDEVVSGDCTAIVAVGGNSGGISKEFEIDDSYIDNVTPLVKKILGSRLFDKDMTTTIRD